MLIRNLTYWCSLGSQFQVPVSYGKVALFGTFIRKSIRKTPYKGKILLAHFSNFAMLVLLFTGVNVSLVFFISCIYNLSEYTFHLHINYVYSHFEWSFLREFEQIMLGKAWFKRFLPLWLTFLLLQSAIDYRFSKTAVFHGLFAKICIKIGDKVKE